MPQDQELCRQAHVLASEKEVAGPASDNQTKKRKGNPFEPVGFAGAVYTVIHDAVCILCVVSFLFIFLARLVGVKGCSMNPTLIGEEEYAHTAGDYLILQSNVLCSGYAYGDIVVASIPSFEEGKPIVKRVIATAGQTVRFLADDQDVMHVYVDGKLVSEDYIKEAMLPRGVGVNGYETTVPEGCYFLMGDNRNDSTDSRYPNVGMVEERFIVGKALMIVLPGQDPNQGGRRSWSRFGAIRHG